MGSRASKLKVDSEAPQECPNSAANRLKWLKCKSFAELPQEGRNKLLIFADNDCQKDKRRLEFWFKCEDDGHFGDLLKPFLSGRTKLPNEDLQSVNPEELLSHAAKMDSAIIAIKEEMRDSLNECFAKFQTDLQKPNENP